MVLCVILLLPFDVAMAEITMIAKLNGRKYQFWKYNIKLVLTEHRFLYHAWNKPT
jgi:hypothetical protein